MPSLPLSCSYTNYLVSTMNEGQIAWFKAGSALNHMAKVLLGFYVGL